MSKLVCGLSMKHIILKWGGGLISFSLPYTVCGTMEIHPLVFICLKEAIHNETEPSDKRL